MRSTVSRILDNAHRLRYNNGMEDQDALAIVIGKNIMRLRKMANMTQLELAEKLNYSDKSVSKWEQGNGIPDIRILVRIAEFFNVTLDDLVHESKEQVMPRRTRRIRRLVIMMCSVGLCWLAAVVCFVLMGIVVPNIGEKWLAFIYAVPLSAVVVLVFSCVWGYRWARIVSLSVLIWTALLCVYLTVFFSVENSANMWLIFLVGIPLQVLAVFFFVWLKRTRVK